MCGIAGIIDRSGRAVEDLQASAQRMNESLAHRGPDDWGIIALSGNAVEHRSRNCPDGETLARRAADGRAEGSVVFGHRRLAIIDLSFEGHQPMRTQDGRFWITFNGEIYNYRELRAELESSGVVFHSTSDTEVLLELFAREGPSCLKKLRGMFAFAVWDDERQQLFLARDRFGIKPLYYARPSPGVFLFASELKALRSSGRVSADLAEEAEMLFLERGSIAAPRTIYREILALPPAHAARWDGKEMTVEPYWSLSEAIRDDGSHRYVETAAIADRVRRAIVASVRAHMVSDVPVGLFLSGGVDSTAILAAIREFYAGDLKTLTIVFPKTEWDEGELARKSAASYGTDHVELEVTKEDFYRELDRFFAFMDQPTVDGVNTFFISKLAQQTGMKVVLSGLGGDEIFGGYKSFALVPKLRNYVRLARGVPGLSRAVSAFSQWLPTYWAPRVSQILQHGPGDLETVWRDYRAVFTDDQLRGMGKRPSAPRSVLASDSDLIRDPFRAIGYLEMEHFMIPQLLRDSDVFTMCHGLELRTPFVDHAFLAAVMEAGSWPSERGTSHKISLFRHMNGFLPPDHLQHAKMGFMFPFEMWLREALSNRASAAGSNLRRFLTGSHCRSVIDGFVRGRVHWPSLWSLYVLERFKASVEGHT